LITADRREAPKVTYILKTVQELLRQAIEMPANSQSYDIIYCAGLFDYLSDRVCAKLVKLFYQWCEPGGRVVVTNVHSSNPVKGLMEHVMEWHLVTRDESDMLRLAPDPDAAKIYTDETGINVFLELVKPST
jgi:extracellular factor (EF) 3-hydroxypalmitic acid methyl ester biosynthesis protein